VVSAVIKDERFTGLRLARERIRHEASSPSLPGDIIIGQGGQTETTMANSPHSDTKALSHEHLTLKEPKALAVDCVNEPAVA
jgi:hypothetical protein